MEMEPIDFGDKALRADPYPLYAELRKNRPFAPAAGTGMGSGILVTRYQDVMAGLKHPQLSSDVRNLSSAGSGLYDAWWMPGIFKSLQNSMVLMDDPGHKRLRDLVHKVFTPKRIRALSGRVEEITVQLLDELAEKKQVDLLQDFALPIPLTIISDMMGVPHSDREKFHHWSAGFLEVGAGDPKVILKQLPNGLRMHRFFKRLIKMRRQNPSDDLLSALIRVEQDGDRLSEEELLSMVFLLLLAGHETTVNLIGTGVLSLLEFPGQLQLLYENPDLIDSAVEELLRYGNPVENGTMRIALEDLDLNGHPVRKGDQLMLMLSSANRDETVFEDPDTLDITRHPNRHLAFGFGIHYCLGAPLARLEGRIAILRLVQRFPRMRLAVDRSRLEWRSTTAVRGLEKLPLILE